MRVIDALCAEHREMEGVLDALERYCRTIGGSGEGRRGRLERFVEYFSEALETRHLRKEEELLFPALAEQGFTKERGPLAVLLAEHEDGRQLLAALADAAREEEPWTPDAARRVASHAAALADLLREHIHKEENVLFKIAAAHLSEAARRRLDEECARLDRETAESSQRLSRMAGELAAEHGNETERHGA